MEIQGSIIEKAMAGLGIRVRTPNQPEIQGRSLGSLPLENFKG
jgi:hypothetical protein